MYLSRIPMPPTVAPQTICVPSQTYRYAAQPGDGIYPATSAAQQGKHRDAYAAATSQTKSQVTYPILDVRDVSKCYGNTRKQENITQALSHVSFTVTQGEFVGIMGPSGSGKSTLLNCIATIDVPTTGSIAVSGQDITKLKGKQLAAFRREQLGFVFQDSTLLDTLTIRENIALPLSLSRCNAREINDRVNSLAKQLGIQETLERFPYEVSGGQKQRAAAARAVVMHPRVVLADEPTGALDTKATRSLLSAFTFLRSMGATIVMVTHDSMSASYCDRILFIRDGSLVQQLTRGASDNNAFHQTILKTIALMDEGE